jgi:hypothetical protein
VWDYYVEDYASSFISSVIPYAIKICYFYNKKFGSILEDLQTNSGAMYADNFCRSFSLLYCQHQDIS